MCVEIYFANIWHYTPHTIFLYYTLCRVRSFDKFPCFALNMCKYIPFFGLCGKFICKKEKTLNTE